MTEHSPLETARSIIDRLVYTRRRMTFVQALFNLSLTNILIYLLVSFFVESNKQFGSNYYYGLISLLGLVSIGYLFYFVKSAKYQRLNVINFLEHINRVLPHYQDASQIILKRANTPLRQSLQARIVKNIISDDENNQLLKILPKINWLYSVILSFLLWVLMFYTEELKSTLIITQTKISNTIQLPIPEEKDIALTPISFKDTRVSVIPPKYTKLEKRNVQKLNLEIAENSAVYWEVKLNRKVDEVFINLKSPIKMIYKKENDSFTYSSVIDESQIYHFQVIENGARKNLSGVYSIAIVKDQSPKIKILNPKQSLIEMPRSSKALFDLNVEITDDYGISQTKIVASVAKGSGEAVKFRDREFKFDEVIKNEAQTSLMAKKQFRLDELDMEPGDEVYFHVQAFDNRIPSKQVSKSSSIIVRWLDDESVELSAEGIRIGFVPEYFRSQRQIIIETIELIEDQDDLTPEEFKKRSVDLGHSQNDLKIKYGQYLGDEFGEGPGEQFGLADGYHGNGEVDQGGVVAHSSHKNEHEQVDDHVDEQENEHEHENEGGGEATEAFGDGKALIEQFTHNHGTEEIAPLSDRDPKTWMKMAVSEMWQAELYLMLSDPLQALPYEKKAYKYLKEARKADRIYAKRLGFEPPPVTEERRLTGELNELSGGFVDKLGFTNKTSNQKLLSDAYYLINQWRLLSDVQQTKIKLSKIEVVLMDDLKEEMLKLSENRPVLIKYVAIIEKIRLANQLTLDDCYNCLNDLQKRIGSLLNTPVSIPNTSSFNTGINRKDKKQYLVEMKKLIQSSQSQRKR